MINQCDDINSFNYSFSKASGCAGGDREARPLPGGAALLRERHPAHRTEGKGGQLVIVNDQQMVTNCGEKMPRGAASPLIQLSDVLASARRSSLSCLFRDVSISCPRQEPIVLIVFHG